MRARRKKNPKNKNLMKSGTNFCQKSFSSAHPGPESSVCAMGHTYHIALSLGLFIFPFLSEKGKNLDGFEAPIFLKALLTAQQFPKLKQFRWRLKTDACTFVGKAFPFIPEILAHRKEFLLLASGWVHTALGCVTWAGFSLSFLYYCFTFIHMMTLMWWYVLWGECMWM